MTILSDVFRVDFQTDVSSDTLAITRCWLPMQLFSNVQVTVETRQEMTFLERFAVEALLKLESVTTKDFMEIASVPPELGRWLLTSLAQKQLAIRGDRGYTPVVDRCEHALEHSSLPVSRNEHRDCLWFPKSNEVVVLRDCGPLQRGLRSMQPVGQYPHQEGIAASPRTVILRSALNAGLVQEDSGAVITNFDAEGVTDESCPAYTARVTLSPPDEIEDWKVTLVGRKKGKAKKGETSSMVEVPLSICYLAGMAEQLRQQYRDAQNAVVAWCAKRPGAGIASNGNSTPVIRASAEFLDEVCSDRLTTRTARFGVSVERHFECELPFRIEPADTEAERVLEIDDTIRRFLADGGIEMDENSLHDTLDRLWNLRLFKPLYQLRAAGDFTL